MKASSRITKGKDGEREVKNELNLVVDAVRIELGLPWLEEADRPIQRNQNQSSTGGHDLVGAFGLAIEIKRQEQLSINAWWDQTLASAERTAELPLLLYRQNRKPWKAVTWGCIGGAGHPQKWVRVEFGWDDFLEWFAEIVRAHYLQEPLQ